jgi:hypothetical protein
MLLTATVHTDLTPTAAIAAAATMFIGVYSGLSSAHGGAETKRTL